MELTIRDFQQALDVQSACNLSGVVNSFCEVLKKIHNTKAAKERGTCIPNEHILSVLYADKIVDLAKANSDNVFDAYREVHRIIDEAESHD